MSTIEFEIALNRVAQAIDEMKELLESFDSWPDAERRSALKRTIALLLQAGARESDAPLAIARAGVSRMRTSAVVLLKGRLHIQLAKLGTLPSSELCDGLRLAISLFAIADKRRRATKCVNGCGHWWHQDLRNERFLERIRRGAGE